MVMLREITMMMMIITAQGPSLLCMNEVLGQLGEIGEIEQEGSNAKVPTPVMFIHCIIFTVCIHILNGIYIHTLNNINCMYCMCV